MNTGLPHHPQRRRLGRGRPADRPGYALLLAVLMAFAATTVVGIMLIRQSGRTLASARMLARYQDHHLRLGLQETLTAWLRGNTGRQLADLTDAEGKALEVDTGERVFIVTLRDGQGSLLRGAGANAQDRAELDTIAAGVAGLPGIETRTSGPAALSLQTAPEPLIAATLRALGREVEPEPFVRSIVAARSQGRALTQQDVEEAATAAGLSPEVRIGLTRLFTVMPQLWRINVEERLNTGPDRGRLIARHNGLVNLAPRPTGRDRLAMGLDGGGLITEWRRVPEDPEGLPFDTDGIDPRPDR